MAESLTRRTMLAGLTGMGLGFADCSAAGADDTPPKNAAEAVQRLREGNQRFVEGKTRHAHQGADWRKHLVSGQKPFATILGCSDSRVPTELVFDQGFGDLFVIRVAGNVIATDVVGTIEYAVEHLCTPLVLVMGHQGCGAVTAALQEMAKPSKEPPGLKALLRLIEPGLPKDILKVKAEERVNVGVEANVRWSLKQLASMPETKDLIAARRVTVAGAVYELTTGQVRFLKS